MSSVLAIAEQRDGQLKKVSLEVISEARQLATAGGGTLTVLLAGDGIEGLADQVKPYGPDRILTASDPLLARYAPLAYTRVVEAAVAEASAGVILLPATALGKDLAARVAARLGAGLASDCTGISSGDGGLKAIRPVYSGKAQATVAFKEGVPAVATLRPNVFQARKDDGGGKGEVSTLQVSFDEKDKGVLATEVKLPETVELDVAEADIVVSGGRAMQGPENFEYIRSLADALGGAVGASRAAVDAGWIDHRYQVGQTGKVVSPKLYIACGISGAIQHLAGMSTSKVIVAINKDAEAPIFKIADYGVVGDLYKVIPALVEEIGKLKEGS